MNRRDFLYSLGGLLTGAAALDAFERLTHRKVFALGGLPRTHTMALSMSQVIDNSRACYDLPVCNFTVTTSSGVRRGRAELVDLGNGMFRPIIPEWALKS